MKSWFLFEWNKPSETSAGTSVADTHTATIGRATVKGAGSPIAAPWWLTEWFPQQLIKTYLIEISTTCQPRKTDLSLMKRNGKFIYLAPILISWNTVWAIQRKMWLPKTMRNIALVLESPACCAVSSHVLRHKEKRTCAVFNAIKQMAVVQTLGN